MSQFFPLDSSGAPRSYGRLGGVSRRISLRPGGSDAWSNGAAWSRLGESGRLSVVVLVSSLALWLSSAGLPVAAWAQIEASAADLSDPPVTDEPSVSEPAPAGSRAQSAESGQGASETTPDGAAERAASASEARLSPETAEGSAVAEADGEADWGEGDDGAGWGEGDDGAGWGEADDTAGFADASETTSFPPPVLEPSPWTVTAFLRLGTGFWNERLTEQPLAKLRGSGDLDLSYHQEALRLRMSLHAERDLAYWLSDQLDRELFGPATRAQYESQVFLRETYVSLDLGPLNFRFGRQIQAWGQGEVISLVDVVNPRDQREPGLADLDDLRLPVTASLLSLFLGDHRFDGLVVHEASFGFRSPPFGPFGPFEAIIKGPYGPDDPAIATLVDQLDLDWENQPERWSLKSQQYLARWSYKGPGLDLALHAARVLDQQGVVDGFEVGEVDAISGLPIQGTLALVHLPYWMLGQSGARPMGSFLVRWELAARLELPVNEGPPGELLDPLITEVNMAGGMLGLTYSGLTDTQLALEVASNWVLGDKPDTAFPLDFPTVALRARRTFLRERLTLDLAGTVMGWQVELGALFRVEASYLFQDGLRCSLGYISYQPGDDLGPLYGLDDHDRLFLRVRYDFQIQ